MEAPPRARALLLRASEKPRSRVHRRLGAGPTIENAVCCSKRKPDLEFVLAAGAGDLQLVRAMLILGDHSSSTAEDKRVSEIDVRVRPVQGQRAKGRPVTALHAASATGTLEVVELLIAHGANPSARMEWLRALTPLHVASTPEIASRLLNAGAQPVALDPREPDPVWYHQQHKRDDVASTIMEWRRTRFLPALSTSRPYSSPTSQPAPPPPRKPPTVPALSAAELKVMEERFRLPPQQALARLSALGDEHVECAICLAPLSADEQLTLLPCSTKELARPAGKLAGSRPMSEPVGGTPAPAPAPAVEGSPPVEVSPLFPPFRYTHGSVSHPPSPRSGAASDARTSSQSEANAHDPSSTHAHLFHAECLSRWVLKKACCPTCRRDVRPHLK